MEILKSFFSDLKLWICNFIIAFIPSHGIRLFYYKYVMKFKIGKNASIHLGCRFDTSGFFSMGSNSTVNQYCHMDNRGGIYIGSNVSISAQVSIVTADHDFEDEMCVARKDEVVIEDYVFIGYGAKIFKNVKMHYGSVLGGASLLTKDTLPYGIYYGVPAKFKKERRKDLKHTSMYKRLFH